MLIKKCLKSKGDYHLDLTINNEYVVKYFDLVLFLDKDYINAYLYFLSRTTIRFKAYG